MGKLRFPLLNARSTVVPFQFLILLLGLHGNSNATREKTSETISGAPFPECLDTSTIVNRTERIASLFVFGNGCITCSLSPYIYILVIIDYRKA